MTRDVDGFCRASGTWAHCMAIVGIRGGSRPGALLLNSWGPNAHTGPRGLGDPSPAGFWADANVVDRMLKQGDSWAFSDVVGFLLILPICLIPPVIFMVLLDYGSRATFEKTIGTELRSRAEYLAGMFDGPPTCVRATALYAASWGSFDHA